MNTDFTNRLDLKIRCTSCQRMLLSVECDPEINAIGILTCPHCGSEEMFDITDQMVSQWGTDGGLCENPGEQDLLG